MADLADWELTVRPNGDYAAFAAKDLSFGVFGHPWEQSICFFGSPAVEAAERLNDGLLTRVLRRGGQPVAREP